MKKTYKELKKGDFIYVLIPGSARDLYDIAIGTGISKLIKKVPVVHNFIDKTGSLIVKYNGHNMFTGPMRAGTKDRDYRLTPFCNIPVCGLQHRKSQVFVNECDARSLLQKYYDQVEVWVLKDLEMKYKECRKRLDSLITKMGRQC